MNDAASLTTRNYQLGDEARWMALLQAAPDFPYAFFNRAPSLDALRMIVEHPQRSPSFRADGVIYTTKDSHVVGECWNWIDDPTIAQTGKRQGDVWCLCVHPQHRRRGLGHALLLAGVQWLRQQGMTSADLYVDGANERARHLYEAVGFSTNRTDIGYREEL